MINTTELPAAVAAYFELMDAADKTPVVDVFAADAVVKDDGHTYPGQESILGWLVGAASEYTTTSTLLSNRQDGSATVVLQLLEGNFPGERIELVHTFLVGPDGQIEALTIAP